MTTQDPLYLTKSTFMAHGVFEARHVGTAARRSSLSPATFDVLMKCLIMGWLDAGYPRSAIAAAEQAAVAAYHRGELTDWGGGIQLPRGPAPTNPDSK